LLYTLALPTTPVAQAQTAGTLSMAITKQLDGSSIVTVGQYVDFTRPASDSVPTPTLVPASLPRTGKPKQHMVDHIAGAARGREARTTLPSRARPINRF
jgi:hypothetical protein